MSKLIDLHIHTFHSDGVMLPSEVISKAVQMNYKAIGITDHADESNLEELIYNFKTFLKMTPSNELEVLMGVELTYIYPEDIETVAQKARDLGAQLVLVHGDSIIEPFNEEINQAVVEAPKGLIDILVHPGFITPEQAKLAAEKDVYLELSARKGHCLTNGYIAKTAIKAGAKLLVNSDAHTSNDLITFELAQKIAKGAGLNEEQIKLVTETYPEELLKRVKH
ncbi:MAG: histidinol phosphate phosphatase domain-containing protein [Cyanobacteriota bacterium]